MRSIILATRSHVAAVLALVALATSPALSASGAGSGDTDPDDLAARIAELERAVRALRDAGGTAEAPETAELERRVEELARELDDLRLGESVEGAVPADPESGVYGLAPAASKVYRQRAGVSLGGYGEALYERVDSSREDGAPSGRGDQLDFLRLILYAGYKFNDRILFNSEIEFEHGSTGREGEVSVEFAYIDFLVRGEANVRAGMVLVPVGFINELHEPPIFLGAARPQVERRLIPATWRENGVGVFGDAGRWSYRGYLTTGLAGTGGTSSDAGGFSASGVRGGRQQGSKAAAEDLAFSGRVDFGAAPGVTVGASWYVGDSGQGRTVDVGSGPVVIDGRVEMRELHAEYRRRGLSVRALWVETDIDDVPLLNAAQGLTGAESIGSSQFGGYAEVGYDVFTRRDTRQALVPYVRYERFDTQDDVPVGFARNPANDATVTTLGVAWKPILNVVVKADWNRIENDARTGTDQLNVALGFLF